MSQPIPSNSKQQTTTIIQQQSSTSFPLSLSSIWQGFQSEVSAFYSSAIGFDEHYVDQGARGGGGGRKRVRNEESQHGVNETSPASVKRRKRNASSTSATYTSTSGGSHRESGSRRDSLMFTEESNLSILATGPRSLSGKRSIPPANAQSNPSYSQSTNTSRSRTILKGSVGKQLNRVWMEAKENERRLEDERKIIELEHQVRLLKEQLLKKSDVEPPIPLSTTALNFFRSPFVSTIPTTPPPSVHSSDFPVSTPPLAPLPLTAPPLPSAVSRPELKKYTTNELLQDVRASLKSTPKKQQSTSNRRLSTVGASGSEIDMGAFLDEMKGVKLRKVERVKETKGKEEESSTVLLQQALKRKFAKAHPPTPPPNPNPSLLPRSQSHQNFSTTSTKSKSGPPTANWSTKRISTPLPLAAERPYQSSSFENSTPTKLNSTSRSRFFNTSSRMRNEVDLSTTSETPTASSTMMKPRRSFSNEPSTDAPPSPPLFTLPKRVSDSIKIHHPLPSPSLTLSKPITTPGKKEKKKKRFSTLPYTYTAASPEKQRQNQGAEVEKYEWEEGEHGEFVGFGVRGQRN